MFYVLLQGLYPESHGIIDNVFYDPNFKSLFTIGSAGSYNGSWWGGEPIWNTLGRQASLIGKQSCSAPLNGVVHSEDTNQASRFDGCIEARSRQRLSVLCPPSMLPFIASINYLFGLPFFFLPGGSISGILLPKYSLC